MKIAYAFFGVFALIGLVVMAIKGMQGGLENDDEDWLL